MKWLLFALGALMGLIGAACVIDGYPIVQVERGWTLTICGAIALTGGAMALALGMTLTRLEGIAKNLHQDLAFLRPQVFGEGDAVAAQRTASAAAEPPPRPEQAASAQRGPPGGPVPPAGPTAPEALAQVAETPRFRLRRAPEFPKPSVELETARAAAMAAAEAILLESRQAVPGDRAEPTQPEQSGAHPSATETSPDLGVAAEGSPVPQEGPAPERASRSPDGREPAATHRFRRFPIRSLTLPRGHWPEPPPAAAEAPETAPPAAAEAPETAPPAPAEEEAAAAPEQVLSEPQPAAGEEDWLERAIAGLTQEGFSPAEHGLESSDHNRDGHDIEPEPEPESARSEHVEPALELKPEAAAQAEPETELHAEHGPEANAAGETMETAAEQKLQSEAAESDEDPTIVGRYETEGTTYVMFSDGSIEAQSAAGVYRFESLTALKTHIESLS